VIIVAVCGSLFSSTPKLQPSSSNPSTTQPTVLFLPRIFVIQHSQLIFPVGQARPLSLAITRSNQNDDPDVTYEPPLRLFALGESVDSYSLRSLKTPNRRWWHPRTFRADHQESHAQVDDRGGQRTETRVPTTSKQPPKAIRLLRSE
jgi:hypothetical protein